jgi:hypothetical protein
MGMTATGVTGAAYTNNDLDVATGTTLYDIDSNLDLLVIQNPPNDGDLNIVGALDITLRRRLDSIFTALFAAVQRFLMKDSLR